jgi:hypothetical protein
MPLFKTPMHFSYLTYLGIFSKAIAQGYLRFSIAMCKATQTEPSLLLHPLDFMGKEDDSDLASFPGMGLALTRKLQLMEEFFDTLLNHFTPVTMGDHVRHIESGVTLRDYDPSFSK